MKAPWNEVKFEQLYLISSRNGLNRPSAVRGKGFKMINMGEIFAHDRLYDIDMELVQLNEKEKETHQVLEGDLIFARQSIVAEGAGKCSIVMEVSDMTCFESHIIRVRLDKEKSYPLFYYYFFQSGLGKAFLFSIRQQGVQAGIRGTDLARTEIPFPSLSTQLRIAHILSAYDDLIENNLKRIKLLEEMAQITYEQWFVRMKFPGHETTPIDAETELPDGWLHRPVGSLLEHEIGGGWGKDELSQDFSEPAFVIRGTDFGNITKGDISDVPFRFHKKSNLASRKLKHGDIIFEVSGGSHYAGVARTIFVDDELLHQLNDDVMCASFCKLVRTDNLSNAYLLYHFFRFLRSIKATEVFEIRSASNIVNYNWTAFLKFQKIPVPSKKVLDEFQQHIAPIHNQLYQLGKQNQLLKEARDILLPRLMTGIINVDHIELPTSGESTEAA